MLAPKAQEHKIWPEKVFSTNNFPPPPRLSSQNDQRDVGIILSHRCWVDPPPPARQDGRPRPEPPPPVTAAKEGGGRVGKMGFRVTPPPPPAEQFSSHPITQEPKFCASAEPEFKKRCWHCERSQRLAHVPGSCPPNFRTIHPSIHLPPVPHPLALSFSIAIFLILLRG